MAMTPFGSGKGEIRSHITSELWAVTWMCFASPYIFNLQLTLLLLPFPVFALIKPSFWKLEIICISQPSTFVFSYPIRYELAHCASRAQHLFINHMVSFWTKRIFYHIFFGWIYGQKFWATSLIDCPDRADSIKFFTLGWINLTVIIIYIFIFRLCLLSRILIELLYIHRNHNIRFLSSKFGCRHCSSVFMPEVSLVNVI